MADIDFKDADLVVRDPANQELVNRIAHKTIQMGMFGTEANAHWKADRMLKVEAYPIAVGSFNANRRAFKLEAGDNFILNYEPYSIENKVWRVLRIVEESPASETIQVQCAEDVHYLSTDVVTATSRGQGASRVNIIDPLQNVIALESPYVFLGAGLVEVLTVASREVLQETGYIVHMSLDGTSYNQLDTVGSYAVHGTLVADYTEDTFQIDDQIGFEIDFDNTDVEGIETKGRADLIAGANMALLGNEILNFQTITPVSGLRYKIEGIYRGRFDTELLQHPAGTDFYFTEQTRGGRFQHSQFLVGTTRFFKYQPYSLYLTSELALALPIELEIVGRAKKPYRPTNLLANGGYYKPTYSDDIVLTWDSRIRGQGAGLGDADTVVDAAPTWEGLFEVEVWAGGFKVRTETAINALTWTYTLAMNISDNGTLPTHVTFKLLNYRTESSIRFDSAQVEVTANNVEGADWFTADLLTIGNGSIFSGELEDTYVEDGNYLVLKETNLTPGSDYDFTFNDIPTSITEVTISLTGRYDGNPAHNVKVQLWNYTTADWDNITGLTQDIPKTTIDVHYNWFVTFGTDYISHGTIRFGVLHVSPGNPNNKLYIDHLHLNPGFATTTTTSSSTTTTTV